jgi:hypothetical protein
MPKLRCFGSPTSFNPKPDAWCRGCVDFKECGVVSLAKVRAYARTEPLNDLAEYLESELRRAAVIPAGEVGSDPYPLPEASVQLTVRPPTRTHDPIVRRELLEEEEAFLDALPKKVGDRMRPMLKRGRFREIRDALKSAQNPFPVDAMPYLHSAVERLLSTGMVGKSELKVLYMERFKWSDGTAAARVAVVSRILVEFGVVDDDGHTLMFKGGK